MVTPTDLEPLKAPGFFTETLILLISNSLRIVLAIFSARPSISLVLHSGTKEITLFDISL